MNLNDLASLPFSPLSAIQPVKSAASSKAAADQAVDAASEVAGTAMVGGDVISLSGAASAAATDDTQSAQTISASGGLKVEQPSDPFRAYRDENGAISLKAIMEIDALPPKLRELGKALKEAQSMKRELDGMKDSLPANQDKYDSLNAEYQAKLADIEDMMDKLGLKDEMKKDGMSLDDLVQGGISGLKQLAKVDSSDDDDDQDKGTADVSKPSTMARLFTLFGKSDKAGSAAQQGFDDAIAG
ncbi:hypothetical protein [Radicibacter daui]|uniref:hypothetical protein n=1 Tax=Radicibacter daui TaxID=3064829 RepID=UPI004046D6E0